MKYDSIQQYFKYQSDLELTFNIHTSLKQNLYSYVDTKVYPTEVDEKEARIILRPNEPFLDQYSFVLDNKLGMKENVKDLILLDLTLKDRDSFLITFSGYANILDLPHDQKYI